MLHVGGRGRGYQGTKKGSRLDKMPELMNKVLSLLLRVVMAAVGQRSSDQNLWMCTVESYEHGES